MGNKSGISSDRWIFDSAATSHMTPNRVSLENRRPTDQTITIGGEYELRATEIGSAKLTILLSDGTTRELTLRDTLVVPELQFPLLSWPRMAEAGANKTGDKNGTIVFRNGERILETVRGPYSRLQSVRVPELPGISLRTRGQRSSQPKWVDERAEMALVLAKGLGTPPEHKRAGIPFVSAPKAPLPAISSPQASSGRKICQPKSVGEQAVMALVMAEGLDMLLVPKCQPARIHSVGAPEAPPPANSLPQASSGRKPRRPQFGEPAEPARAAATGPERLLMRHEQPMPRAKGRAKTRECQRQVARNQEVAAIRLSGPWRDS